MMDRFLLYVFLFVTVFVGIVTVYLYQSELPRIYAAEEFYWRCPALDEILPITGADL